MKNTKKYLTYIATEDPCVLFRDFYYVNRYNKLLYYISYTNDIIKNIYHIHTALTNFESSNYRDIFNNDKLRTKICSLLYLKLRETPKNKEKINTLYKSVKSDLLSWKLQLQENDENLSYFISNISSLIALKTTY